MLGLSCSVLSNDLRPHGLQPTRLLCTWGFSRQEYWSGLPCPPPGDLPNSGIKPRSPTLQADSLPSEPPGKPKNNGVGSLSLLQGIFPTRIQTRLSCIAGRFFTYAFYCLFSEGVRKLGKGGGINNFYILPTIQIHLQKACVSFIINKFEKSNWKKNFFFTPWE